MDKKAKIAYVIAVLLGDAMCITVTHEYCELSYWAAFKGYSAPPYAAFMWVLPYMFCIAICLVLAEKFAKKKEGNPQ